MADTEVAVEGSGAVASTLGTEELALATGALSEVVEAWLVDAAPWSLASAFGSELWRWVLCGATVLLFWSPGAS